MEATVESEGVIRVDLVAGNGRILGSAAEKELFCALDHDGWGCTRSSDILYDIEELVCIIKFKRIKRATIYCSYKKMMQGSLRPGQK